MSEKPPQNPLENVISTTNQEDPLVDSESAKEKRERLQHRDEELEKFYNKINDVVKRHQAEFHTASLDILGGFKGALEKMGK